VTSQELGPKELQAACRYGDGMHIFPWEKTYGGLTSHVLQLPASP